MVAHGLTFIPMKKGSVNMFGLAVIILFIILEIGLVE
jgi:hypothetical protein